MTFWLTRSEGTIRRQQWQMKTYLWVMLLMMTMMLTLRSFDDAADEKQYSIAVVVLLPLLKLLRRANE